MIPDADIGYFDVFKKYDKIRMILGGHNHFYAIMNAVPGTDFVYVTVGNGGISHTKIQVNLVLYQNNMSVRMDVYTVMLITIL
jgi:hypothetical protein